MGRHKIFTVVGMAFGSVALTGTVIGGAPAAGTTDQRTGSTMTATVPGPDRAVFIQAPGGQSRPVLAVSGNGRTTSMPTGVGVSAGVGIDMERLFVLSPLRPGADRYLLRTATPRDGGEPSCLTTRGPALVATACDATTGEQIAELEPTGTDERGRPEYDLVIGGRVIEIGPDGAVTTRERGDAPTSTTFVLVDAGPATDPLR